LTILLLEGFFVEGLSGLGGKQALYVGLSFPFWFVAAGWQSAFPSLLVSAQGPPFAPPPTASPF